MKYYAKNLYLSPYLERDIFALVRAFKSTYRMDPKSILLGPNEFLAWEQKCREEKRYFADPHFHGIPIRCKRSDGIELEIDPKHAVVFAKGDEKEVDTEN